MKKHILRALACAVMVALALITAAPSDSFIYPETAEEIACVYTLNPQGGNDHCFFSAKGEICRLPFSGAMFMHDFSLDSRYAAAIGGWTDETGGALYRISAEGCTFIADRVYHGIISDDGEKIAYIQFGSDCGKLYLYDHGTGTAELLDESVITGSEIARFLISPDGSAIAYCRAVGGDFTGLVWNSGEYIELGAGAFPVAVANGATHLYYAEAETNPISGRTSYNYYVETGGSKNLIRTGDYRAYFKFNRDLTECSIGTRITTASGEVKKIPYEIFNLIVPQIDATAEQQGGPSLNYSESYNRYDIPSFIGQTIEAQNGDDCHIARIREDYELDYIMHSGYGNADFQVAADGQSALICREPFIRESSLETLSGEILIKDAVSYVASPDLSEIYYTDTEGDLYYVNRNDDKSLTYIATGAELLYCSRFNESPSHHVLSMTLELGPLYFTTDEGHCLNAVVGGGKPKKVLEMETGKFSLRIIDGIVIAQHMAGIDGLGRNDYYLLSDNEARLFISNQAEAWQLLKEQEQ